MSFAVEVIADDSGWTRNAIRFATPSEAEAYGADLASRWTAVREWRVAEDDRPVNYAWVAGHLRTLDDPPLASEGALTDGQ